jgi:Uma2 family endonuclease
MLRHLLIQHVFERNLGQIFGDVDTIFGEHDVRRPDLIFFSKGRLHLVGEKAMEGPPDLCVEILSPSSTRTDRADKFEQYRAGGVAHYWIIDPDQRTIEAYSLQDGVFVLTGRGRGDHRVKLPPFPELQIPLGQLWRPK